MRASLFDRILVPVASVDDAASTAAALERYEREGGCTVVAVHVVEKAGGAPDKASVEQRERDAEDVFEFLESELADTDLELETEILYGTDVAETIVEAAHDLDAGAIVFTPRGGSRWVKLLTGDVTTNLVGDADLPVLVLPDEEVAD